MDADPVSEKFREIEESLVDLVQLFEEHSGDFDITRLVDTSEEQLILANIIAYKINLK